MNGSRFVGIAQACLKQSRFEAPVRRGLATAAAQSQSCSACALNTSSLDTSLVFGDINNMDVTRFQLDKTKAKATHPPNHPAEIGVLSTFVLPETITESQGDVALGKALVNAWRKDGILQVAFPPKLKVLANAIKQSKKYFARPHSDKSKCVDSQSFAGYIASGEELTDGIADYSEIFTVTKDLSEDDLRVKSGWPCHGPTPWPDKDYEAAMKQYMDYQAEIGEKLLKLTSLGLGLKDSSKLNRLTEDGWHHMRVLRFPPTTGTNGKGQAGRGIGSHTDYGLLVIAAQDEVGGLFVRRPMKGENYENWNKSSAGLYENDSKWTYVPPMEDVFTVFPGDMMQFMTNSFLPSTPHKVGLNLRERFAFAYFHEPNFNAVIEELEEFKTPGSPNKEAIHYGSHFTNMFMRNYPDRITAKRMREEGRMALLEPMKQEAIANAAETAHAV